MIQELRKKTIPGLLLERVKRSGNEVAYRAKRRGIYRESSWLEFKEKVAQCALGLKEAGLKRGQRLALMGDPCEEYIICELAALALGAVTFGIYATSSQKQIQRFLEHGGARFFLAENQEITDLILPVADALPELKKIVVIKAKGLSDQVGPALIAFDELMLKGTAKNDANPGLFDDLVKQVRPSDTAFIIYTAGTTARPKGVVISHGHHLAAAYTLIDRYPVLNEKSHRTIVYLPLAHTLGKTAAITLPLLTHIVPHFGESLEMLGETLFETAPTVLITVPAYLKKFSSNIFVGIEKSSPLKKWAYRNALKLGHLRLKGLWRDKKKWLLNLCYRLCRLLVFNRILNKMGLNQLEIVVSTDAPLSSGIMAQWQALGVPLCEGYTQTESGGGLIAGKDTPFSYPGDVGRAPKGWEVELSAEGEILVKSDDLFTGYWQDQALTKRVVDAGGWFHTGDIGKWTPDGGLQIIDRQAVLDVDQDGEIFSPNRIETVLRSSPYISEAIAAGPGKNPLGALIEVDFESVSTWARFHDVPHGGYLSLVERSEVVELIGRQVENANRELGPKEKISRFRLVPHSFNGEEEASLLTPTKKVRRDRVFIQFKNLLASMKV
jgi:long-chain acyl-CoA synthetase